MTEIILANTFNTLNIEPTFKQQSPNNWDFWFSSKPNDNDPEIYERLLMENKFIHSSFDPSLQTN